MCTSSLVVISGYFFNLWCVKPPWLCTGSLVVTSGALCSCGEANVVASLVAEHAVGCGLSSCGAGA